MSLDNVCARGGDPGRCTPATSLCPQSLRLAVMFVHHSNRIHSQWHRGDTAPIIPYDGHSLCANTTVVGKRRFLPEAQPAETMTCAQGVFAPISGRRLSRRHVVRWVTRIAKTDSSGYADPRTEPARAVARRRALVYDVEEGRCRMTCTPRPNLPIHEYTAAHSRLGYPDQATPANPGYRLQETAARQWTRPTVAANPPRRCE